MIEEVKQHKKKKPFVIASIGGEAVEAMVDKLNEEEIPAFDLPEKAISAMAALYRWSNFIERHERLGKDIPMKLPLEEINKIIKPIRKEGRVQMLEHEAKELFKICGL